MKQISTSCLNCNGNNVQPTEYRSGSIILSCPKCGLLLDITMNPLGDMLYSRREDRFRWICCPGNCLLILNSRKII